LQTEIYYVESALRGAFEEAEQAARTLVAAVVGILAAAGGKSRHIGFAQGLAALRDGRIDL
jgi:hypothetical protein